MNIRGLLIMLLSIHRLPQSLALVDPLWIVHAHDYCARFGPHQDSEGPSSPIGLLGVNIVFRHAARGEHQKGVCFANEEQTKYKCTKHSSFNVVSRDGSSNSPGLIKFYDGEEEACSQGQMLDIGDIQVSRLGEHIKKTYPKIFNESARVHLYSTDTQRTLATLNGVIASIYSGHTTPFKVHTREFSDDFLALNIPSCPLFARLRATFYESSTYKETLLSDQFHRCASRWRKSYGSELNLKYADDCLLSAYCANATLPGGRQIDPMVFKCVVDMSFNLRRQKLGAIPTSEYYKSGQKLCQIGAYKVFELFHRTLHKGSLGGLYSLHDETFVCLLSSLGLWDMRWPKYAEHIAFEHYEDGSVRIVRDGRMVGFLANGLKLDALNSEDDWNKLCRDV
jgi:hypothetical protein